MYGVFYNGGALTLSFDQTLKSHFLLKKKSLRRLQHWDWIKFWCPYGDT